MKVCKFKALVKKAEKAFTKATSPICSKTLQLSEFWFSGRCKEMILEIFLHEQIVNQSELDACEHHPWLSVIGDGK